MDSFSDAEKRFVLAEMIKTSTIGINDMVAFLKSHDISPDWEEMQLPRGRNIKQCKEAAIVLGFSVPPQVPPQVLWNQQHRPLVPAQPQSLPPNAHHQHHLQEQSINSNHLHPEAFLRAEPSPKPASKKRKFSDDSIDQPPKRAGLPSVDTHGVPRLRQLKPKASENEAPSSASPPPRQRLSAPIPALASSQAQAPPPKRRGRPTNASKEAQRASIAAAAAAKVAIAPGTNVFTPVAKLESFPTTAVASQTGSPAQSSEDVDAKTNRESSSTSERSSARP